MGAHHGGKTGRPPAESAGGLPVFGLSPLIRLSDKNLHRLSCPGKDIYSRHDRQIAGSVLHNP